MPPRAAPKKKFSDPAPCLDPYGAGSPSGETAPPQVFVEQLPREVRDRLPDELVDELLAGARTEEEIAGPGGLLAQLTKRLIERAMAVELTDHVGYEHGQSLPGGAGNARNGTKPKTLATQHGKDGVDAP